MGLVSGIGVYHLGKYISKIGGVKTPEYVAWSAMLVRCYSTTNLSKNPTYIGCSVSENFKNFQFFAEWCNNQVGWNDGYSLDKDILVKGNKVYHEDLCVFVPHQLNSFVINRKNDRGVLPLGVYYKQENGKFCAQCNSNNSRVHLGYFSSSGEAFQAYKTFKEALAKELAKQYSGRVDERVIIALNNFTVEITD